MEKKISIVGMGSEDNLIASILKKADEILNSKDEKPPFVVVLVEQDTHITEAMIIEMAKMDVPIVICDAKQKELIDKLESSEVVKRLNFIKNLPPIEKRTFIIEKPPEMIEPYIKDTLNTFGGHKKSKNQKLRRR